jgi:hypothetical protein
VIATAIVVTFVSIVAGVQRAARELRVASVQSTASPSPPRAQAPSTPSPRAVRGDAPWALSALPECFHQTREVNGPPAFVDAAIPPGATAVQPGRALVVGDCTVAVGAGSIEVRRGTEWLRVPPVATLYALPNGDWALLRREAHASVLRIYGPGFAVRRAVAEPRPSADNSR